MRFVGVILLTLASPLSALAVVMPVTHDNASFDWRVLHRVRFALGYGQHLREMRWPRGVDVGEGGTLRSFASTTLFRSSGCYAFQADGTAFSTVVVMRVTG